MIRANSGSPIPGTTTHPDQHAGLFVPDGLGGVTLFAGNDGGVYKQHVAPGQYAEVARILLWVFAARQRRQGAAA